jgi:hypothetical protein
MQIIQKYCHNIILRMKFVKYVNNINSYLFCKKYTKFSQWHTILLMYTGNTKANQIKGMALQIIYIFNLMNKLSQA